MKKTLAFIAVGFIYICIAFGFSWADNAGLLDSVLGFIGLTNNNNAAKFFDKYDEGWMETSVEQRAGSVSPYQEAILSPETPTSFLNNEKGVDQLFSNIPIPRPPYPEPGAPPDVKNSLANIPIPRPPYPEPGAPPDVKNSLANIPIPRPPYPEPGAPP
ncbi:MAG: hypothetical protein GWP06_16055, partial [Actinobacteria bacterium]|nr:hypothetical protein [Actinomycetota bacterium]